MQGTGCVVCCVENLNSFGQRTHYTADEPGRRYSCVVLYFGGGHKWTFCPTVLYALPCVPPFYYVNLPVRILRECGQQ